MSRLLSPVDWQAQCHLSSVSAYAFGTWLFTNIFRQLSGAIPGFGVWGLGFGTSEGNAKLPTRTCSTPCFFVRNEGMRALYNPLKGICRALIPSFPTKNQPVNEVCKKCMEEKAGRARFFLQRLMILPLYVPRSPFSYGLWVLPCN